MNTQHLDDILENLCLLGCRRINMLLQEVDNNHQPSEFQGLCDDDCTYLYNELRSIMSVYGDKGCQI